ncbi:hypothetical protein MKW94_014965 [Papaver nudicaule]|uniref:Uncharacterized protein n=1 Tax=Papaver nudicaule TaxID=74823 RepID=A0AA41V4U6_PAPNU|nr:hypothetical protein [Papaver nudicaule]
MDGDGGAVARIPKDNDNQMINQLQIISRKLAEFQTKFKELGNGYRNWVSKQSFPVEATVITASSAIQGAACGGLIGAVAQVAGHAFPGNSLCIRALRSNPMAEARSFAAMEGARASINCIMKRIRRKEDAQTRMAAGFGAGVTFKLMTSMGHPYVAIDAVILGLIGALVGGSIFELGQKTSQMPGEYTKTRCMLSNLGLQNYEKNFKEGLLTDITIPLLTDSVLRDARVPPGPRLLILDHIARDPELQKMGQRRVGQLS